MYRVMKMFILLVSGSLYVLISVYFMIYILMINIVFYRAQNLILLIGKIETRGVEEAISPNPSKKKPLTSSLILINYYKNTPNQIIIYLEICLFVVLLCFLLLI